MKKLPSINIDYCPTRADTVLIKLTSRYHPDVTIGTIPASHHNLVEQALRSVPIALTPSSVNKDPDRNSLQIIHENGRIYALILHNPEDPDSDTPLPTITRQTENSLNPAMEASLISLDGAATINWHSPTCGPSYNLYAPIPHTVSLHRRNDANTTNIVPVTEIISLSSSEHVLGLMPRHACCFQHATELKAAAEKHLLHLINKPGDNGAFTVEIRRGDHPTAQFNTQAKQ